MGPISTRDLINVIIDLFLSVNDNINEQNIDLLRFKLLFHLLYYIYDPMLVTNRLLRLDLSKKIKLTAV